MEKLFDVDGGVSGGSYCILFGPFYTLYVQLHRSVHKWRALPQVATH